MSLIATNTQELLRERLRWSQAMSISPIDSLHSSNSISGRDCLIVLGEDRCILWLLSQVERSTLRDSCIHSLLSKMTLIGLRKSCATPPARVRCLHLLNCHG